jgi:DNA-directed RNA polymerase specialized sigma24 family protein
MDPVPIARLERDWRRQLASAELACHLRQWQAIEPALRAFSDPAAVLRFLRRSAPGERQDRVLRALVSPAGEDPTAGRLVLHALLPGLKRISARLLVDTRDQEELWSTLLACAWQRIHGYPVERRPRRVAANVLLDTLHDAVAAHRRAVRDRTELDVVPAWLAPTRPQVDGDIEAVTERAVLAGAITAAEADLILCTRIDGVSLASFAHPRCCSASTRPSRSRASSARVSTRSVPPQERSSPTTGTSSQVARILRGAATAPTPLASASLCRATAAWASCCVRRPMAARSRR